jgi:hypothetical protein
VLTKTSSRVNNIEFTFAETEFAFVNVTFPNFVLVAPALREFSNDKEAVRFLVL